jgi:hypothetical protein
MTILSNPKGIITGVKPKIRPTHGNDPAKEFNIEFDKTKPLAPHNFPLTKYTDWKIYGYKKDPYTGIKRPYWLTKRLPTGRPIEPKMVGLDGFFDIKPLNQVL